MIASDPSPARLSLFAGLDIATATDNLTAASSAEIVLLCVKPQMMPAVLEQIRPGLTENQLIVSIAAGISTDFIAQRLGAGGWRVVRVMPNTPMLVGEGATAICRGGNADAKDLARIRALFETASAVVDVDESQMDTVTAVSGSGPAYFFYLVEQMIAAGVELGLTFDQARELVYATACGAAEMLTQSPDSPQELRRKVTSPGGTTQAAIESLDADATGPSIRKAIAAAQRRGRELRGE
jgi:pyrroline-5-carboxylate reductase